MAKLNKGKVWVSCDCRLLPCEEIWFEDRTAREGWTGLKESCYILLLCLRLFAVRVLNPLWSVVKILLVMIVNHISVFTSYFRYQLAVDFIYIYFSFFTVPLELIFVRLFFTSKMCFTCFHSYVVFNLCIFAKIVDQVRKCLWKDGNGNKQILHSSHFCRTKDYFVHKVLLTFGVFLRSSCPAGIQ